MQPTADFEPVKLARSLLRRSRQGALATLMAGTGDPYCSLVNIASYWDGSPILLISTLAIHTRNLKADPRASLMIDERKEGDPLEGARIMLMGTAAPTGDEAARRRYLARHPEAEQFAGFKDFSFYRMEISRIHLVAGFGRIVDLKPQDVLTDVSEADALRDAEAGADAHMNEDHADALRLYATKLLKAADGEWRCTGCDPEGLDLRLGRTGLRLPFPQRVNSPGGLRAVLKQLAEQARAMH
jgi:putative heme iron utilization protein